MSNPKIQILLSVEVVGATTQLTAQEHADAICGGIRQAVGTGLLTAHEPEAEIEQWETRVIAKSIARPASVPSNEILRGWAISTDNETCWGLAHLVDYIEQLEAKVNAK